MKVKRAPTKAPTIKDVANAAGVAVGTVSRVLNAEPSVNQVIRQSVLTAINDLNYRPSPLARNLRKGSSGAIGLVLADLSTPALVPAVPVAQSLARAAGRTLIVVDSQLDRSIEENGIRTLLDMQVDGLLWKPLLPVNPDLISAIGTKPAFLIGPVMDRAPLPYVGVNIIDAALTAVGSMLDAGHRKFGVVSVTGLAAGTGFVHGLRTLLGERGAELVSNSSWTFSSRDGCRDQLTEFLRSPERPTAVFVVSTLLAPTLVAAREAGLRIPDDLALAAIGDSEVAQAHNPPIDVVTMDYDVQVAEAMETLLRILDTKSADVPRPPVPRGRYIERGSISRFALA